MFKFVNTDASNPTGKRKQAQRACEGCRKRKKRCYHHEPGSTENEHETSKTGSPLPPMSSPTTVSTILSDHQPNQNTSRPHYSLAVPTAPTTASEPTGSTPHHGSSTREAQHPSGDPEGDGSASLDSRFIGDLNPEGVFLAATSPGVTRGASSDESVGVWLAKALTRNGLQPASDMYISSPSSLFYGSTSELSKVLLPLLEKETVTTMPPPHSVTALTRFYFEKMHPILPLVDRNGFENLLTADPRRILLQQGICLAASKSFIPSQHLVLPGSDSPLSYREFGNRLSAAMRISLEMGLVADKIVRIQAFALLSHFNDGPENADVASQLLSRAIQHAISLGLHIEGHRQRDADEYTITLFCSLWALDRMNAAFGALPVMMHHLDMGRDLERCFESQQPCFRIILEVALLLDKVIALYRPSTSQEKSKLEFDFPSFEELVTRCTGSEVATRSLATIETFYHAVAMLSYRSKEWDNPQRSSPAYLRQSLASSWVSTLTSHDVREQLVLFSFVPYAFSLSLSVAYREMRHSKVPMSRARARVQFQSTCNILCELGEVFSSGSAMAEMGKATLKEMDRVFSVVAISEQRRSQPGSRNVESSANGIFSVNYNGSDIQYSTSAIQAQRPLQPMPDFDPSLFDSISDMDLFGMFDPTFDLNSLDTLLEGNLDLSFPIQLQ